MADRPFERPDPSHTSRKRPSKKIVATRPRMPRMLWWTWAVALFAAGALLAWLLDGDADAAPLRIIAGGFGFVVVGMIVVESIWDRRRKRNERAGETADH